MHRGLPFDVRVPNAETIEACARVHLTEYADLQALKSSLD